MRKNIRKILIISLVFLVLSALNACGAQGGPGAEADEVISNEVTGNEVTGNEVTGNEITDREGNILALQPQIDTIISIGPANTEIIAGLGFGDSIIATDTFSEGIPGIEPGISVFDMMALDVEHIISLHPDIIFLTGLTMYGGDSPLEVVSNMGITVINMPFSTSIEAIKEDIRFIAHILDAQDAAEEIVTEMEREIEAIRQIGDNVTERRRVYFEIAAAPNMITFGSGVFLHEIIEIAGAENVFADQADWFAVSDEVLLAANPDVILTSVDYLDDPITEIMNRPGWGAIRAVQEGAVFQINTDTSNRASQNIVKALREIARAIHPDLF